MHRPPREADAGRRLRWLYSMWTIVTASGALWGAVFLWSMHDPMFETTRVASLLATRPLLVDTLVLPVTVSIGWAEFEPAVHGDDLQGHSAGSRPPRPACPPETTWT